MTNQNLETREKSTTVEHPRRHYWSKIELSNLRGKRRRRNKSEVDEVTNTRTSRSGSWLYYSSHFEGYQ
jgi:hypothetical protein